MVSYTNGIIFKDKFFSFIYNTFVFVCNFSGIYNSIILIFKPFCTSECTITYINYTIRYRYIGKILTIFKSTFSNAFNTIRNGYRGNIFLIIKSIRCNAYSVIFYCDICILVVSLLSAL